jgi:hypothetical protein
VLLPAISLRLCLSIWSRRVIEFEPHRDMQEKRKVMRCRSKFRKETSQGTVGGLRFRVSTSLERDPGQEK